jgi:linoleate 8R-lipoxygenase/9,12-octadecadienoate 8-hydroperoxide 8R-isomerase
MPGSLTLTLVRINEGGRFTKPKDGAAKEVVDKYDNDLFQTGRLITCGLYVNCVLKDYVRTILSLNRTGTKWDLDPRASEAKTLFNSPAAEGTGNQVSAEFNLSKWHSRV